VAVFRSHEHIHVNVVDDTVGYGNVLFTVSSVQEDQKAAIREKQGVKKSNEFTGGESAAEIVGAAVAKKCLENNITTIVFDRGGFPYEGRVKALAEAARTGGLQF